MGEMTSDVEIPRPATPPKKPIISPEKHFNRHFSPSITHSGSRGKKNEILSHLVQVRDKWSTNPHKLILSDLADQDTNVMEILASISVHSENYCLLKLKGWWPGTCKVDGASHTCIYMRQTDDFPEIEAFLKTWFFSTQIHYYDYGELFYQIVE